MGLHVAAAVSEHPIPAHAVGACLGEVLEAGGPGPVAVVVAVTEALVGALEDVVGATRQLLGPEALLAVTVSGVLGGAREVDGRGAVMMFALWDHEGRSAPVRPVRFGARTGDGSMPAELDVLRGAEGTLVLFCDPFSVDAGELLDELRAVAPAVRVVGGELSAARHSGGNRLVLDATTWTDGAVGLLLGPLDAPPPLLSRAARGLGAPMTVTEVAPAAGGDDVTVVTGLAGRPARTRLDEVLEGLSPEDRTLAAAGLYLGDAPAEGDHGAEPAEQRSLLGVDADSGGLAFAGVIEVGAAVRFEVRDPAAVEPELLAQVAAGTAAGASGAFAVLSASRGARFHGHSDGDAAAVAEAMDPRPVAGVVVGAEFTPLGGRNRRLTSSLVVQPIG